MKTVTIYELLGLVKEDKAPKKIKYNDKIYTYRKGRDFNFMYNSSTYLPLDKNNSLFKFSSFKKKDNDVYWYSNAAIDFLNAEVEVLEVPKEDKKLPEKLESINIFGVTVSALRNELQSTNTRFENKINELIDYFKSKGDE